MNIQDVTGFNAVQYNALVEQAEARGVSSSKVDEALLAAVQAGKDFSASVGHVTEVCPNWRPQPQAPCPTRRTGWGCPAPSNVRQRHFAGRGGTAPHQPQHHPGSGYADCGPYGRSGGQNRAGGDAEIRLRRGGAVVNMAAGAASIGVASSGTNAQLAAARAQAVSTMISSAGTIISSGGDYAQGLRSAEAKRLEAEQEQVRTMMEQTRQTNDALKDLIAKSLDFMNAMQANMNQTRTKILG